MLKHKIYPISKANTRTCACKNVTILLKNIKEFINKRTFL